MKILILAACFSASLFANEFNPEKIEVGDLGQLPHGGEFRSRVQQIIKGGMLVSIEKRSASGNFYLPSATVLVKGVSTDGLVDGKELSIGNWFEVSGTTQYKTVLGASKTVFVLNVSESPEELKARMTQGFAELKKKKEKAATEKAAKAAKAKAEDAQKKHTLFSLADGRHVWVQRDTDLGEQYSIQDADGKWQMVKKSDVLSIKRPE